MVHGMRKKSYDERLLLGLYSLQTRRLGDLIETFEILTGREDVDNNTINLQ